MRRKPLRTSEWAKKTALNCFVIKKWKLNISSCLTEEYTSSCKKYNVETGKLKYSEICQKQQVFSVTLTQPLCTSWQRHRSSSHIHGCDPLANGSASSLEFFKRSNYMAASTIVAICCNNDFWSFEKGGHIKTQFEKKEKTNKITKSQNRYKCGTSRGLG